ncbi:DUF429 domain-containing protein [Maioricimonas sp. JC845]|uniref:DUF429 domain-containing protein n=1 Tax=Maioricimonas sp. JC845 TaxID=3232138 RepID=UPI0034578AFF
MDLNTTMKWLQSFKKELDGACIDGPPCPNNGALARELPTDTPHNTDRRLTEFQLGIGGCYSTRREIPQEGASNYWMQSSFELFRELSQEFDWPIGKETGKGRLIETHPTYAFKALLGCELRCVEGIQRLRLDPKGVLRRKRSDIGKYQRLELLRQLASESGIGVDDATENRWRERIDWVDASICALMSYWHRSGRADLRAPGDPGEGAIFLRIPSCAFTLDVETAGQHERSSQKDSSGSSSPSSAGPPQNLLDDKKVPANARILRLGDRRPNGATGTDQLTQLDTIDTVISSQDLDEVWLPVGSPVPGDFSKSLDSVSGRLFLAWGGCLRASLIVNDCRVGEEPIEYPYPNQNPWPFNQCRCWLKVERAFECERKDFLVNHGGHWKRGFARNQTSLLWAVVPE